MDPTGTKALTEGLQAFSSGYTRFQAETAESLQPLRNWCDGMDVAVVDVQEGLATVHADIARLENDMNLGFASLRADMDRKFAQLETDMSRKFAILFKHLGIE